MRQSFQTDAVGIGLDSVPCSFTGLSDRPKTVFCGQGHYCRYINVEPIDLHAIGEV